MGNDVLGISPPQFYWNLLSNPQIPFILTNIDLALLCSGPAHLTGVITAPASANLSSFYKLQPPWVEV
jgi:hypothetical protein